MSHIFETVTGTSGALAFKFNGQFALKNYNVEIVNGNRLRVVSTANEMFSLLEADVSEVEINGTVYSNPEAAQLALTTLVHSDGEPVVLTKEQYMQLAEAVQSADRGKILPDTPAPSGGWQPGWYTPGLFENNDSGTNYPNQNNLKAKKGFITKFLFNGVTWDFVEYEMPQATQSIVPFSTSVFPLVAPTPPAAPIQRTHNNSIWQLADGQTASSTDVPGVSNKWVSLVNTKFGVDKIVFYRKPEGVFYLTVLKDNGQIRIDWFPNFVNEYDTATNNIYYAGIASTDSQKKGIDPVKLKSVNTEDYLDVYANFEGKNIEGNAVELNKNRRLSSSLFDETKVLKFNPGVFNSNFDAGNYFLTAIVTQSFEYFKINNNSNAYLYLTEIYINRTTQNVRLRFRDKNAKGEGVDDQVFEINYNLSLDEYTGEKNWYYGQQNIYYRVNFKINNIFFREFIERAQMDFGFFTKPYETNNINLIVGKDRVVGYNGNILNKTGYIVANGNTLSTSAANQYYSDYISISENDDIRIISMNNNLVNEIFGFVVCICVYDENLELTNRVLNDDLYNLKYKAGAKDKYIRFSCGSTGVSTFRVTINREKEINTISTLNALKRLGNNDTVTQINDVLYTKSDDNNVKMQSNDLPKLTDLESEKININLIFNSNDGKYVNFPITSGVLQWVDKNDNLYFTKNIGYNADLGMSDRTVIFYSKDYCTTFNVLYDSGDKTLLNKDWELMCLFVSENGNIYFTKSETGTTSLVQQTLWEIKGWKNGEILNGKDSEDNNVTIKRKFKFSYDSYIADRPDLDFAQYGQTIYPDDGITLGSSNAARGRMLPGWTYNVYDNIVVVTEYGEGDSYWTYKNKLKDEIVNGKHTIVNKTNGLGVSSKVWISLDYGENFKIAFDVQQKDVNGRWKYCGDGECTHLHAVNFDPYNKMFYVVNGDLTRDKNISGYESWMTPNQRICRISYEDLKKWWDTAETVNSEITPSPKNYTGSLPNWEAIILPAWRVEGYGHEYQLQFGTIEPFPNSVLFSTDSDINVGFFRFTNRLDFVKSVKELPQDDVGRSHFGGNQQYLRNGSQRIISVTPHHANTVGYIYSTEDGNNFKLIFKDVQKRVGIEWGCGLFPTKKGVYCRPGMNDTNVFVFKNKSNFN